MRKFLSAATLASLVLPLVPAMAQPGQSTAIENNYQDAKLQRQRDRQDAERARARDRENIKLDRQRNIHADRSGYGRYDFDRPDPTFGNYQADRYYYGAGSYRERELSANDRVYRGQDSRYYCRRSDGTTGLIIGGLAGGLLGNAIAPGDSRVLGTLLGVGAGAAIGGSIDHNQRVTCR